MEFTVEITNFEMAEHRLSLPARFHPEHLISINSTRGPVPKGLETYAGNKLVLRFDDIIWPTNGQSNFVSPSRAHVVQIVEFARSIDKGHLLVHCRAGISRSTAATLIVLATRMGPDYADQIEEQVRRMRPVVRPNDLMLELADDVLGWNGMLADMGGWSGEDEFLYGGTRLKGVS